MGGSTSRLADRRLRLGLTQKRLAALAGVDQSAVSRAEWGRAPPAVIEQLREALTALERQREEVDQKQADAFWSVAGTAPNRDEIIERVAHVARVLLAGSLAEAELAHRLIDCLPESSRRILMKEAISASSR